MKAAPTALLLVAMMSPASGCASPATSEKAPAGLATSGPATSEPATTEPATSAPDGGGDVIREELPNARVRLKLRFMQPALRERTIEQTIWMRGSRFRVREAAGRGLYEILGDVTAPRGLGLPARTLEDIMDRNTATRQRPVGVTEVFGDLATDAGWVLRPTSPRWAKPAHELLPIARQVLAGDRTAGLQRTGSVKRLGREAVEYRGTIDVQEDGARRTNKVVRVIDPPFVLLDDVRNAEIDHHYYVREVVAIEPDVVTDADLALPP